MDKEHKPLKNLEKVSAYTVNAPISERENANSGVYNTYGDAHSRCENAGWYGARGTVVELHDIYIDDDNQLYKVTKLGKFTNIREKEEKDMLASIKGKLTPAELEFAKLHLKDKDK